MAPPHLLGLFQYSTAVNGHHGHNPSHLYVPQVRTNYGRQSLYVFSRDYAMEYFTPIVILC